MSVRMFERALAADVVWDHTTVFDPAQYGVGMGSCSLGTIHEEAKAVLSCGMGAVAACKVSREHKWRALSNPEAPFSTRGAGDHEQCREGRGRRGA